MATAALSGLPAAQSSAQSPSARSPQLALRGEKLFSGLNAVKEFSGAGVISSSGEVD